MTAQIDDIVKHMIEIRDRRSEIKKEYEEKDSALKERYEKGENYLLNYLNEQGLESLKVSTGTVYTTVSLRASIADKEAFKTFVRESGEVDLFESRVSTTALKVWMEENNQDLPPGVKASPERKVNVRRK